MRILVAEDYESVREMVGGLIREVGHTPVLTCNGREAWELLNRGERFDLVLSDNDMPEVSGLELLRQVRADARTAGIPFVLMSSDSVVSPNDRTPLVDVCAKLGARFLEKPFPINKLLSLLDTKTVFVISS